MPTSVWIKTYPAITCHLPTSALIEQLLRWKSALNWLSGARPGRVGVTGGAEQAVAVGYGSGAARRQQVLGRRFQWTTELREFDRPRRRSSRSVEGKRSGSSRGARQPAGRLRRPWR
jgi:hypothetical protein